MPNWNHNTLTVTGDKDKVAEFVEHSRNDNQPLTFEADVPMPEGVDEWQPESIDESPVAAMFGGGWYGWAIENWGTKWDASFGGGVAAFGAETMDLEKTLESHGVQLADGVAIYKFDTAWSPPVAWLVHTCAKWDNLEFVMRFAEVGHGVAGQITAKDGQIVDEQQLEVEDVLAPEEMWF